MSKLSDAGVQHQWRHPPVHSLSPLDRIPRGHNDRHPVEIAVDNRIGDRVRRKWIGRLQNRIVALLGPSSGVYMKLEAMLNEQALDRERNFFNVGYEYGKAERAMAGQNRLQRPLTRAEQLVRDLLRQASNEQISRKELVAALLRCSLAITDSHCDRSKIRHARPWPMESTTARWLNENITLLPLLILHRPDPQSWLSQTSRLFSARAQALGEEHQKKALHQNLLA